MEIVKVNLENEMDLMLSYKRSMKLAELCGLSVLLQTSFATAVSEIARCVIKDKKDSPYLTLAVNVLRNKQKELVASVTSKTDFEKSHGDALKYARRLSENVTVTHGKAHTVVQFVQPIALGRLISEEKLNTFLTFFRVEPPLSPYDEIRKKNILLLEVSEKLRTSENRYRELTKTLPLMIFTTNGIGNINYGNKHLLDFFRLGEIPDKHLWIQFVHHTETGRIREEWDKAMLAQSSFSTQAKIKGKDKDDFTWHLVSVSPAKNDDNVIAGWAGFFVDIHAQKLVEETLKDNKELKAAQRQLVTYQKDLEEKVFELNRSNHDLEQFAYIASHDLQEPLRKIRTFANIAIKTNAEPTATKKYLQKIESSSDRMSQLIKDVLNYSKLMGGDDSFVHTDLNETFSNIRVDMELLLAEKKAVLDTTHLPVLPAIPQQVYQLFYNLVGNALKFNEGVPYINISSRSFPQSRIAEFPGLDKSLPYTEIIVEDNGIGFDEQYAEQVFIIFKRLHSRTDFAGTGIGLALCKKIVENHHGAIFVKSEEGKGSQFHIILPMK